MSGCYKATPTTAKRKKLGDFQNISIRLMMAIEPIYTPMNVTRASLPVRRVSSSAVGIENHVRIPLPSDGTLGKRQLHGRASGGMDVSQMCMDFHRQS